MWRANQKNDAHVFEYYTDNNHIAWTYTLHGTFTYDGSRSIVVSSMRSMITGGRVLTRVTALEPLFMEQ